MASRNDKSEAPLTDVSKLSKVQKLGALLVILGPESAAQIIKHLEDYEVEAVSAEMSKFAMITQEMQDAILKEFSEVAVEAGTAILGGVDFTRNVLEKAVGLFRASDILSRVSPTRAPVAAMQQIVDMDARQIFNLIRHEQAQTIALVTSYLATEKASHLMGLLRPEQREHVIERLATLAPTPIEVVEKVVELLNQKLGVKHTRALNQTGGVKMAAQVLNALDKNVSKSILISLEERNPELGQAVRQKMFTFEDLSSLDSTSLQKILREVDMRDLAVSLKTASEKLRTILLSCISKRAAETVNEEISFMGPLKLREIEGAQLKIIEVVRRLESEGEIELDATGETSRYESMAS